MDEYGTRIGIGGNQEVVTLESIPPLSILRGAVIMHQHVSKELNLNPNLLLRVSSSSYINNRLGIDYIYHFNKYTKLGRKRDRWRMLIFNSHTLRIWPFLLPSHTTYILQPLDIAVFQPFKYYHKKRVEIETRLSCDNFNKVEFLHAIQDVRKKAYKPGTLQSAFKQAGLWPYNLLAKLPWTTLLPCVTE
ncbi:hypothetical protein K469DRAFT_726379 [Zopfia rhizophila CBS 207.26]|uniref:DDE-1 domain-containing protein n=1 Tax=Zopfia rhizophila CBS 207.26 TaxID=1314779 RepID=A0A6A6E6I4_9PEZI|nr:hypothetical protein K469DRAFT_726379 [Zopfia rhizophila CBS 207.26]